MKTFWRGLLSLATHVSLVVKQAIESGMTSNITRTSHRENNASSCKNNNITSI